MIEFSFLPAPAGTPSARVISGVWELKTLRAAPGQCFAPDGCPELVIHLAGSAQRSVRGHALSEDSFALVHPVSGGVCVSEVGPSHIRALRFRPSGLFALGVRPESLRDLAVDPRTCLGDLAQRFEDVLLHAPSLGAAMDALNTLIADKIGKEQRQSVFSDHVLARLVQNSGEAAIEHLTGWSARHVRRLMLRETGYTPSEFERLARFHRARQLIEGAQLSFAEIAATCGYADQAHMSHHVKRFIGTSPAALRQAAVSIPSIYESGTTAGVSGP